MDIEQIAREHLRLEGMLCWCEGGSGVLGLESVVFLFEGGAAVTVRVDPDSDELFWDQRSAKDCIDASKFIPSLAEAYGLRLIWCWEMKNHQGYFDALQMEFSNSDLSASVILQFKAMASGIFVYSVNEAAIA